MRRILVVFAIVCAVVFIAGIETSVQGQGQDNGVSSEVQAGKRAVPPEITLNLAGKNKSLVYEGSYYVNGVSDCGGCHTSDDQSVPLEDRYLAGGVNFGPVFTRNLTPDATGKPAGLTFDEFLAVIRVGRDWKNLPPPAGDPDTLIIMPWPAYRFGTDRYVRAIYEYLSTIPCLPGGPAPDSATRCD
jgi:hypothetical protein